MRAWREPVLSVWQRWIYLLLYGALRWVGGARLDVEPRIECRPGVMMLLNHQSILDILLIFGMIRGGYARVIANERYAKGILAVSVFIRLYRHMTVKLGDRSRVQLDRLREFAATSEHPIAVFPEGHRTKDGNVRPWKTAGLKTMLSTRKWQVHVIAIDGLWESAHLRQVIRNLPKMHCVARVAAVHEFDPERDDADELITRMESDMCAKLAEIRRGEAATGAEGSAVAQGESAN